MSTANLEPAGVPSARPCPGGLASSLVACSSETAGSPDG